MTPDAATDLADAYAVKEDEVLEREGLETELMSDGRSDAGEDIGDADEERKA